MVRTTQSNSTDDAPFGASVRTTLGSPKNSALVLEGLRRQQALLQSIALTRQAAFGASQEQLRVAADHFQKTIGPLLEWAKKPRVRSELFMYRKSATAEKFSKLVSIPLEKLILILNSFFEFLELSHILPITQRRAQIMSLRGLALSCAPNVTRISDINSFSRLYRGFA
jgi:hypothetical protein